MNINRVYLFNALVISMLYVLLACGKKDKEPVAIAPAEGNKEVLIEDFYISDTSQTQVAAISIAEMVQLYIGESYLSRDCRDDQKCKYRDADGMTVYEIKYGEDGFKIRDPEGSLLLKIKYTGEKIKIGDEEEMIDPFEIKSSSPDKVKLVKGDDEIGQARMGQGALPVKVTNDREAYYISGPRKAPADVVMAIPDAEISLRIVLLAELLSIK